VSNALSCTAQENVFMDCQDADTRTLWDCGTAPFQYCEGGSVPQYALFLSSRGIQSPKVARYESVIEILCTI